MSQYALEPVTPPHDSLATAILHVKFASQVYRSTLEQVLAYQTLERRESFAAALELSHAACARLEEAIKNLRQHSGYTAALKAVTATEDGASNAITTVG